MYRAARALGRFQCLRPIGEADALKLGVMHQIKVLVGLNSQSEQWLDICKFQLIQAILQIKKTTVGADNVSRIKSGLASKNLCELRNLDVIWHNRNHKNIQVQGAIHVFTPCRQKCR